MSLITEIRDDLLGLIRATAENADTPTLARVLSDINAAVQHIYELGPDFWSVTEAGMQVRAPMSLSGLTLANGETTISGGSLAPWMHGCTVQLGGEGQQNEIRQTGSATYALAMPYQGGATSSGTGVVYHDALNLPGSVTDILPPILIPGKWELWPANSVRDLYEPSFASTDHGRRTARRGLIWDTRRVIHTPDCYRVERNLTYQNEITTRIRLNPLPDAAYVLRWRQRNAAYRVTSLDDTVAHLVPHGYKETLLMPVARKLFSGGVHWALIEEGGRREVEEGYGIAMQLLRKLSEKQPVHTLVNTKGGW